MRYVVVYEQTPKNWSAYVPDVPGCVAAGDTREDVEKLIQEALTLHLAALREDDEPLPQPGTWAGLVEIDEQEVARLVEEFSREQRDHKVCRKRKSGT